MVICIHLSQYSKLNGHLRRVYTSFRYTHIILDGFLLILGCSSFQQMRGNPCKLKSKVHDDVSSIYIGDTSQLHPLQKWHVAFGGSITTPGLDHTQCAAALWGICFFEPSKKRLQNASSVKRIALTRIWIFPCSANSGRRSSSRWKL